MQAAIPNLADMVSNDTTNVVEFYSCPKYFGDTAEEHMIDMKWSKPAEFFNLENPQEEVQYYHRDMCYVFDVGNDAQRCFRRTLVKDTFYKNFYIVAVHEESVPSHRFPSTQDISATVKVTRYTQKINNRMTWIYEKGENGEWSSYVRYHHAPNVEMTKMQGDLEKTLTRMPKPQGKIVGIGG